VAALDLMRESFIASFHTAIASNTVDIEAQPYDSVSVTHLVHLSEKLSRGKARSGLSTIKNDDAKLTVARMIF
jgi:hypothetical protein